MAEILLSRMAELFIFVLGEPSCLPRMAELSLSRMARVIFGLGCIDRNQRSLGDPSAPASRQGGPRSSAGRPAIQAKSTK